MNKEDIAEMREVLESVLGDEELNLRHSDAARIRAVLKKLEGNQSWLDEFDDMHMSQPKTALLREALMRKGVIDAQNLPEDAVVFFKEVCDD